MPGHTNFASKENLRANAKAKGDLMIKIAMSLYLLNQPLTSAAVCGSGAALDESAIIELAGTATNQIRVGLTIAPREGRKTASKPPVRNRGPVTPQGQSTIIFSYQ